MFVYNNCFSLHQAAPHTPTTIISDFKISHNDILDFKKITMLLITLLLFLFDAITQLRDEKLQ